MRPTTKTIIITIIAIVAFLFLVGQANARCIANDGWTGQDKQQHAGIGAFVGMTVAMHTRSATMGTLYGTGVGLAKEIADAGGAGTCSLQDFAVTAIGAAIGANFGKFIAVRYVNGTTTVSVSQSF